jgi:hypothetical protein
MRLTIVELGRDETVFYNLGIFNEDERILYFQKQNFCDYTRKPHTI